MKRIKFLCGIFLLLILAGVITIALIAFAILILTLFKFTLWHKDKEAK